jgi:tetratricopeptide (TPR) repeat protein
MNGYWYRFGYIQEGRGWHERALALVDRGDRGDAPGIVDALHGHGVLALQQNEVDTARQALERALGMAQRLGDLGREARECNSLGIACRDGGDVERARALIERSIELARRVADPHREATALSNSVLIHLDAGDHVAAADAARRAVAADEALGDPWGVAIDRCNLVRALLHTEGPEPAYRQLLDVAPAAIALGDVDLSIDVLDTFAAVWAALGDGERSGALLGAADNQRELAGIPRTAPDTALLDWFVVPAHRRTDPHRWDGAYAWGRGLSVQAAVEEGSAGGHSLYTDAGLHDNNHS